MTSALLSPGAADALLFDLGRVVIDIDFEKALACWNSPEYRRAASFRQPPIADLDHLVKVRDCLATRLDAAAAEHCIALASQIDTLAPARVGELMALVGTGA